jgi:hypothetical protein
MIGNTRSEQPQSVSFAKRMSIYRFPISSPLEMKAVSALMILIIDEHPDLGLELREI